MVTAEPEGRLDFLFLYVGMCTFHLGKWKPNCPPIGEEAKHPPLYPGIVTVGPESIPLYTGVSTTMGRGRFSLGIGQKILGRGGSSIFEPLVRGVLFNFHLPLAVSHPVFFLFMGIGTHLTQSTTKVTPFKQLKQVQLMLYVP